MNKATVLLNFISDEYLWHNKKNFEQKKRERKREAKDRQAVKSSKNLYL